MDARKQDAGLQAQIRGQLGLLRIILPRLPLVLRVIALHILKVSESAKYLDIRSDITVSFLRNLLSQSSPRPISHTQALTLKDAGVKGRIWVSTVASQVPPELSIRDVLLETIQTIQTGWVEDHHKCRIPDIVPVQAEWTGYRAAAQPDSRPPEISEEDKYSEMMKECKSPATVLYFHGGAYYLCDPSTHRAATKTLAKLTKGRVYSVRYRLAPQNPFPSAVLDALVSYFTLLYPPPGAVHEAVEPHHIVFAGDSAGGNLSLSLLQTLLEIRRRGVKITWFGMEREVPLPAGVSVNSPWVDMVQSLPSWDKNLNWDYLPTPSRLSQKPPPADDIWPASPPRKSLYIDDSHLLHPLASLQFAPSWEGAPPIYLCTGWECLADEDKYLATKLSRDGVTVVFEEYEAMPHVFALILKSIPEARRCFEAWSKFITAAVENPGTLTSTYTTIKAKTCEEIKLSVDNLSSFVAEDLKKLAFAKIDRKQDELPEVPAKL